MQDVPTDQDNVLEDHQGHPPLAVLEVFLKACVDKGASDLHLTGGHPPTFRINGALFAEETGQVSDEIIDGIVHALLNPNQLVVYQDASSIDLGFSSNGERFRINLFRQRGRTAIAVRHLSNDLLSFTALRLPESLVGLSRLTHGLVLICGATGSGKSTTLAAILDEISRNRACHIMTVEDPIEFIHEGHLSLVHQRELHSDVPDFASAVRASLREDPDVLMVGEMRDIETMRAALTAAETGHLVFSTLHTGDAVGAIERLVGSFPTGEQDIVRHRIAMILRAVVAQHLLPAIGGRGRVPAVEILLVNRAIANLIENAKTSQIYSTLESSSREGMQTLEQSLVQLVKDRWVDAESARSRSRDVNAFDSLLGRAQVR
ncbi:MAG: PilT/PilU family type 4a pilus ATPase [Pseudomonadota bacterium]